MNEHIDPEHIKEAMRCWITGVTIVTGCHKGAVHGMTANSFNSVALSPPTVLVALQQGTRTNQLVQVGGVFGVTILDINQAELARRFAGQIENGQPRFEGVETFTMVTGSPLIEGGLAYLDCKVVKAFDVGETTVFMGEVLATKRHDNRRAPLLYYNRHWRKLVEG